MGRDQPAMPPYRVNDTTAYHAHELQTIGWELTICNALEPSTSPCRSILRKNATYGELLCDFLSTIFPFEECRRVLEIGGGYGYVMRDVLMRCPVRCGTMVELSPVLLAVQRETLKGLPVEFLACDFFDVPPSILTRHDYVILNEVIGDFPSLCDIDPAVFSDPHYRCDPNIEKALTMIERYGLPIVSDPYSLNIGAIEAVERICSAGIHYAFISEHSCEAVPPPHLAAAMPSGNGIPRRIPLKGHDEYTIRFSDLEHAAHRFGYRTVRGTYADILPVEWSGYLQFILTSNSQKDEHEIIRHFVEDLYIYEYLILIHPSAVTDRARSSAG